MAAALLSAAMAQPASNVRDELVKVGGFSAKEAAAFDAGGVIARVAPGADDREVAALAAVRIRAAKDATLSYFNQFISYEDGSVTLQYGRFSRPPVAGDLARLTLDRADVDALRTCRPGDCDIRVGGAIVGELQKAVDWKAPDAATKVTALARDRITAYAADYLSRGNAALITYNDQSKPVSLATEWQGLLANTPHFAHYAPALKDYLDQFPRGSLPGASDVLYWAKENYGLPKPVTHVTHLVTWRDPARPDRIVMAQKQIYASHYYHGSLAISTFLDAPPVDGKPATYLLYFNRSRGDLIKGGFGGIRKAVAQDQARKAAVQTLTTIRDVLEKAAGLR